MKINDVFILDEAVDDLNEGKAFYDLQATGIGDYFWDCLISDRCDLNCRRRAMALCR